MRYEPNHSLIWTETTSLHQTQDRLFCPDCGPLRFHTGNYVFERTKILKTYLLKPAVRSSWLPLLAVGVITVKLALTHFLVSAVLLPQVSIWTHLVPTPTSPLFDWLPYEAMQY